MGDIIEEKVRNTQVVAKDYISGNPKETDMYLRNSSISLKLPSDTSNTLLVKNLYLSCDPYMRGSKINRDKFRKFSTFVPDTVCIGNLTFLFFLSFSVFSLPIFKFSLPITYMLWSRFSIIRNLWRIVACLVKTSLNLC